MKVVIVGGADSGISCSSRGDIGGPAAAAFLNELLLSLVFKSVDLPGACGLDVLLATDVVELVEEESNLSAREVGR